VCDPVLGMTAIRMGGQIAGHQQKVAGVNARNRQRLRQFDHDNIDYLNEVKLNNAQYFNDVAESEVEQEGVFSAMVNQWQQADQQLDEMFANHSFKLQDELVKMYTNEYAGTQTGATAARLAGQSAREKGFAMAKETNKLLLAQEEVYLKKEGSKIDAMSKIDALFEKVRHPPVHGHTPVPPELEAKPSSASLILGLAGSALQGVGEMKDTGATATNMTQATVETSAATAEKVSDQLGSGINVSPNVPNIRVGGM